MKYSNMKRLFFFIIPVIVIVFLTLVSCQKHEEIDNFVWPLSTPEQSGLDEQIIDSAFTMAGNLGFVDGLLVIKDGFLIAEHYYNGYNENTGHQIYSDTKSFMSALIGIAVEDGLIESLDKRIMDYFPEYEYRGMDPRFYDITVKHLLMMRMGIDKEENNLLQVIQTGNWVRETFKLPLIFDPGEGFSYNSLETHLLSAILTKVSGVNARQYARSNLTGKMGIEITDWKEDPQGNSTGGYDIYMRPRDMAVLGYLYLSNGRINNTQIVPESWVETSLKPTLAVNGSSWGALEDYNYGYLWWLGTMRGYKLFMALGMGGQYIICFPGLEMIVVTTANKDISWDNVQELPILDLVSEYILRSVL